MTSSFTLFRQRLERDVLTHPIILANPYTQWFRQGAFTADQARAFLIQFSVFSNQFLVAQLQKTLNAQTLQDMRASKEILINELGVGYRGLQADCDPDLGGVEGSVEGGTFHFRSAHFEMLVRMAGSFGLQFADLGRRSAGIPATLHFCDELKRLYASEDYATSAAASWAVENWAARGFWDELVEGWLRYAERGGVSALNMSFFTWHARIEANHARHTWQELGEFHAGRQVDEEAFVRRAREMLDAVAVFWQGLDEQRRAIAAQQEVAGAA